jgi:hypothetical protein
MELIRIKNLWPEHTFLDLLPFLRGQFRTGLLKVGLPGADLGLQPQDPTIADLLKSRGYMTFQNGKNHLGDRNEFLPTVHGFSQRLRRACIRFGCFDFLIPIRWRAPDWPKF